MNSMGCPTPTLRLGLRASSDSIRNGLQTASRTVSLRSVKTHQRDSPTSESSNSTRSGNDAHPIDRPDVILYQRALTSGQRLVLLVNAERDRLLEAEIRLHGSWRSVAELQPWDGSRITSEINTGFRAASVRFTLQPKGCRLLLFDSAKGSGQWTVMPVVVPGAAMPGRSVLADRLATKLSADAEDRAVSTVGPKDWSICTLDPNALVIDQATWRVGDGVWAECRLPTVALDAWWEPSKHGPICLAYTFESRLDTHDGVRLVVEDA